MFNLAQLQAERSHKVLLAQDLIDKAEKAEGGTRPMTVEECGLFDKATAEIANLDVSIAAVVAHEKRCETSAALVEKMQTPAGRQTTPETPQNATNPATGTFKIPATARRTGVLKAFKGADADERAFRAGKWLRAAIFNDARAQHWCQTHGMAFDVRNAMGGNSNTDGGFLSPDEFSMAVIDLREQYGVFRQNVRVLPMGRDTMLIPRRLGGVTIGPIGENPSSAISQSNPTFNQVQLTAKKCGGLTLMSTEIAEDAVIDLADWIAQEFAYGFATFEDQCGFIGDGTSTYLGIRGLTNLLTEASGLAGAVQVATVTHDLFSEIDNTDLTTLIAKLPQYARANAKFYCSSVCMDLVFSRLKAVAGGNTVMTLGMAPQETYLGFPIVISQVLPSSTSAIDATPMLLFGDLRMSSTMGDRREIRVFPSEHRFMDTDQIGVRATERIDIVNHDVGSTSVAGAMLALTGSTS